MGVWRGGARAIEHGQPDGNLGRCLGRGGARSPHLIINHEILGLEVTVRNVACMEVLKGTSDIGAVEGRLPLKQAAATGDEGEELAALDEVLPKMAGDAQRWQVEASEWREGGGGKWQGAVHWWACEEKTAKRRQRRGDSAGETAQGRQGEGGAGDVGGRGGRRE